MRQLVLTPKFKRAYHKFTKRNIKLRQRIDDTLRQMEQDVYFTSLSTHKLSGGFLAFGRVLVAMIAGLFFR